MDKTLLNNILLSWYGENHRKLPWRESSDPFKIWLSEIILQQTRVAQGLPYYLTFINLYPRLTDLAMASEEQVLRTWQGLGYYTRARNMHRCARIILNDYNGRFPDNYSQLLRLPGIGPYTAAAIASMAFNKPVPVIDGNVNRVLSRIFGISDDVHSKEGMKKINEMATRFMPREKPGIYNQALMEFGALVCTPGNPDCMHCPVTKYCYAFINSQQFQLPVIKKKKKNKIRYFHYFILKQKNKYFFSKRDSRDIWKGLYEFLLIETPKKNLDSADHILASGLSAKHKSLFIKEKKHILSHQIIIARFYKLDQNALLNGLIESLTKKGDFFSIEKIHSLPKPVLIDKYLKEEIF